MPRNGKAMTLTAAQVTAIGADWQAGMGSRVLAARYGITRNTVYAYLAMAGVRPVNSRIRLPRGKVTRMLRRHSRAYITKHFGVSYKVLRDHLIAWGLPTSGSIVKPPPPPPAPEPVDDLPRCAKCRVVLQAGAYELVMRRGDVVRVCAGPCK